MRRRWFIGGALTVVVAAAAAVSLWRDARPEEVDAADFLTLRTYDGRVSESQFRAALERMDPTGQLAGALRISADKVVILDEPDGDPLVEVAFAPEDRARPTGLSNLRGKRILLDPGHFGGHYSEIERRHFTLHDGPIMREGHISFGVARLLQRRLEAAGAIVRLSRGPEPSRPFDALAALAQQPLWPEDADDPRSVFEAFNREDLARRGWMAQAFEADITISIHFNMALEPSLNGIMVLVPGHALESELGSLTERFFAVRRALEGDLPASDALGTAISQDLQTHLDLPALTQQARAAGDPPRKKSPVDEHNAVWARNLAILKRAAGPVLLIEGPCMNNPDEYGRLTGQEIEIDGEHYPRRLVAYSDGVFDALARSAHLLGVWGSFGK